MTTVVQPLAASGLCLLLSVLHVPVTEAAISVGAAAASGAIYAAGGVGGGRNPYRDENAEFLVMLAVGCAVGGIVITFLGYVVYRLCRRHVFKIQEPNKNFVVDKKVKCRSGHNMMLFHVPSNVSSFINCGSKSACDKQEVMGGFAAWYSCPVCAYRICSGCASVDVPDYKDKDKFKMENLLIGQFMQHITAGPKKEKRVQETHSGSSPLPGQVP